jgi:hypothetical protein
MDAPARILGRFLRSPRRGLFPIILTVPYIAYIFTIEIERMTPGALTYVAWVTMFLLQVAGIVLLIYDNRGSAVAARRAAEADRSRQPWNQ